MKPEAGNWKPYNVKAILGNLKLVFTSKDITKLNKPTYNFLYLLSGFIAHYNLYGFQDYYQDLRDLVKDLDPGYLKSDARRDETDGDFNKWYGEAYNKSKADIKRGIAELVETYGQEIHNHFAKAQSTSEIGLANVLAMNNGYKLVKQ